MWKGTAQPLPGTGSALRLDPTARAWARLELALVTLKANALYCLHVTSFHEEKGESHGHLLTGQQRRGQLCPEIP